MLKYSCNKFKIEKTNLWIVNIDGKCISEISFYAVVQLLKDKVELTEKELNILVCNILARVDKKTKEFYKEIRGSGLNLLNWQIYYIKVMTMTEDEKINLVEEVLRDDI